MPPTKSSITNVTIGGRSLNPYTPLSNSSSYLIGGTPKPVAPKLNTNTTVPSTALTKPATPADVMTYRNNLQGVQDTTTKISGMATGAPPPIVPVNTIYNAESAALKFLNGETAPLTPAQEQEKSFLGGIRDKTKEFFGGREKQIEDAYKDSGVSDARTSLAETQGRKAERQVQLRNDLKALETTASERGVTREAAIDRRNQVNSDAYFDLANISIVESAQLGNLEQARTDAKELIDQQYNSYDAYIKQQQAELDYLKPTLTAEQKQQADIAQFNLDQYKQQLQDAKDAEQKKYDYLAEAAKNGAPNNVTDAILKATTQEEAARLAAPYIGLIDRQNTYSLMSERGNKASMEAYVPLNPEDKKTLLGQGFTQTELDDIPKTVGDFGVQAVLDYYANDPKKLKAITEVYNDPQKQKFLTPQFLTATFGASSVDEKAKAMGKSRDDYKRYFSSSSAEEKQINTEFATYLTGTLMPLIEQYRLSGLSDKEILAMMK